MSGLLRPFSDFSSRGGVHFLVTVSPASSGEGVPLPEAFLGFGWSCLLVSGFLDLAALHPQKLFSLSGWCNLLVSGLLDLAALHPQKLFLSLGGVTF